VSTLEPTESELMNVLCLKAEMLFHSVNIIPKACGVYCNTRPSVSFYGHLGAQDLSYGK
jgi:hypothetical protein